jgi:hypothetical protein
MFSYPEKLYNEMLGELLQVSLGEMAEEKKIETCFGICMRYLQWLEKWVKNNPFASELEEINFFKRTKPLFTGRVEFYKKRYNALIFCPGTFDHPADFWRYELRKLEDFFSDHTTFYTYYKSSRMEWDRGLFLRTSSGTSDIECDRLLGELNGAEQYRIFVQQQLERLSA